MSLELIGTFFLLIGLELVLGIDNILLISILTLRLPKEGRGRARFIGLGLALLVRFALLFGVSWLIQMSEPLFWNLSWRSLILLAGGAFLLFKSVKEIHHVIERPLEEETSRTGGASFFATIGQIVFIDIVFSFDSIITAVGLTDQLLVIYAAVLASFILVLLFSGALARFIHEHVTLKILALAFLVTIGVTLIVEGLGGHVPKGYIYLPMGFALILELLHMRRSANRRRMKKDD